MGPEIMAGLAAAGSFAAENAGTLALASSATTAAGTVYSSQTQAAAMRAQATADQARAEQQQKIAEAKGLEEKAFAQRAAGEEMRSARLAQARLGAVAGASGSGSEDPSVMQLWEGIQKEGEKNASAQTAAGAQKAQGLSYQAALDRWTADANAGIRRSGADATALGGYLTAGGQMFDGLSRMGLKYGGGRVQSAATGYGR